MIVLENADLPWEPADQANFTGSARIRRAEGLDARAALKVFRVEFQPGARTNWHEHTGVQLLLVLEGRCRVQKRGEPVREVEARSVVAIQPGEEHWHGAAPGAVMTHLAVNVGATTRWLAPVSDEEYAGS
jgi:quercetin dioxygenase-like cupin family protein